MASLTYTQAFDPPSFNDFDYGSLDSGLGEMLTSNLDHPLQPVRPENNALVDDLTGNELKPWDDSENLSCSLSQGNQLGLDSSRPHGIADSASLDPWYEALTTSFGVPKSQTDKWSFNLALDPGAAQWSTLLEDNPTDVPSTINFPTTPVDNYQLTPDLTECSTPTSPFTSNSSRDPTVRSTASFVTDSQRWHATLSRSRTADRYFLYGVSTTKIFCRPSCASRRPSRRYIRFFSFPGAIEAAEQAKFRPCKRCKPAILGTGNTAVLAISQVLREIIAETFGEQGEAEEKGLKLESLAKSAGLSTFHFHRLFKATTQVTPADFITACRALALQDYLCTYPPQGARSSPCVVQLSQRWSQRRARKALGGLTPEEFANGANSVSIRYCCVSSPVGDLEVAYSGNQKLSGLALHTTRVLQDSSLPIGSHFGTTERSEEYAQPLRKCIRELEEECKDRDAELAVDVLCVLWRVRLWLKLTHDNGLQ